MFTPWHMQPVGYMVPSMTYEAGKAKGTKGKEKASKAGKAMGKPMGVGMAMGKGPPPSSSIIEHTQCACCAQWGHGI